MSTVSMKIVSDKGSLNREQPVTKTVKFPSCTRKTLKKIWTGTESMRRSLHRDKGWHVWWQGTIKEKESEWNYLENYSFFDWQPVNRFDKWSNVFMSAFAKKNFRCLVVNFLQPVHLITVAANEQRLAVVQPIENKRIHQINDRWLASSGDGW